LANLPALQTFIVTRVFFDDNLLSSVCQNPRLAVIQIKRAEVSKRAIKILGQCRTLKSIGISYCPGFPYEYRAELVSRRPQADIVAVAPKAAKAGEQEGV
jgi:hypothetical protein